MDLENMPVDSMMNQMPVDQMDAFPEYFVSLDPPILLIGAALLFSILSGVAFQGALVEDLNNWKANPKARSITSLQNINLILPFLGMAIGSSFFLSSGVETFGFPPKIAYAIAIPMAFSVGWLVWKQLGSILRQIEQGGSAAIDLDDVGF
ncbi:MAG: hypothetical protein NT070_20510 [Cyanobacteria bacterium]|jgi:hypothetical protein|nr:hypothetical protein [Cyanobacteriota bacterium]